ncbi:hypothetical protein C4F50_12670 [Flavobacterium sp. KB82]|uniref:Uncharacterized protein n=1 Tax=Flavobacterium hungaricum TaxID=2082725 RepID=A0ABR9TKB7_9FLAO|nr:hypothetical protein [Flavobacterium hungaricum]
MIKKMIIFVLLASLLSCKSQNPDSINDKIVYTVIFANGFENASIDLYLNDIEIIKNGYLNTNESDGVTNIWLDVIKRKF